MGVRKSLPIAVWIAGGVVTALAAISVSSGCGGVTKTLTGGQAIAFSSAVRAEEKARTIPTLPERRAALQKAYEKYIEVITTDPNGSFTNRARYQAAQIKKELPVPGGANYDEADALLQQIIQSSPSGYRAGLARSESAAIRKNRQTIQQAQRIFDNTPEDATDKMRADAIDALYEVAGSFEVLRDYDSAIARNREIVALCSKWSKAENDEFYRKAARSQFQIGNIYFYRLYNYEAGWPEYAAVYEMFPKSFEADQAGTLLKKAKNALDSIHQDQEYIRGKRKEKASEYIKAGRRVNPNELYGIYAEQVAQTYLNIAQTWERDPLRNLPNAIDNYRLLVDELWNQAFLASDGLFQIGRLYQDNGEYEQAIAAYDELFERFPQSFRRGEAVYNQAVCYETMREFDTAYRQYKAAASLGDETSFYRAAEQKVRQFEQDEDQDGFMFYQEQQAGTSDKDAEARPGSKPFEKG
jgi:tetratricopeptide (TPR) repeat protein